MREARETGHAIADRLFLEVHLSLKDWRGDPPDLLTRPGEPGHVPGAPSRDSQRHYFAERLGRTDVYGDVAVGDEVLGHVCVAEYAGPPPYSGGPLVVHPGPAILLVGAPKGWSVRVESEDGSSIQSRAGGEGPLRFILGGGHCRVRRENAFLWFDGKAHGVDLQPGEKVRVELTRSGLAPAAPPNGGG